MANNVIVRKWKNYKTIIADNLAGFLFTGEEEAHTFIIKGEDINRQKVPITGTITAKFWNMNTDVTVPISGSTDDGDAVVTLDTACYADGGLFMLTIYTTEPSAETCIYCGLGTVIKDQSENVGYPSAAIPDLVNLVAEVQAVIDSIPEDYTSLVNDIKAAKDVTDDALGYFPIIWEQGTITSSGTSANSKFIRSTDFFPAATGDTIEYSVADGYVLRPFSYSSGSTYKGGLGDVTGKGKLKITIADVGKIKFRVNNSSNTAVLPYEGYNAVMVKLHGKGTAYDYANVVAKNDDMTVYWEQGNINSSGESTSNANIRNIGYISTGMIGSIKAVLDNTVYNTTMLEYDTTKTYIRSNPLSDGNTKWLHPDTAYIRLKAFRVDTGAITPDAGGNIQYKVCSGRLPYVTPQMFGAIGDGVADDTEAFRTALNSGHDVCVPFSNHEVYLITAMVTISKPLEGSQTKRLYGDGGQTGYIFYDVQKGYPDDDFTGLRSRSLFRITDTQAFTFDNLNVKANTATINGVTKRVGGFLRANDDITCDYDIKIRNCGITKFYRFVAFKGRGFTVENSGITSMQTLGTFDWDDEYDTNQNHPANMDQRAIIFKGNRLHSIQSGGITVRSGHAYGLVFTDNVLDVGRKYAIIAYDEAWNWTIANNTLLGYVDEMPVFEFKGGAKNLMMTGNQFISDSYFWVNSPGNPTNWILSEGVVTGSVISSNIIKNAKDSLIHAQGLLATTICNNILTNPGHVVGENEDGAGSGEADEDADNPYQEDDYIYNDTEEGDDHSGDGETETGVGCIYIEDYIQNSAIIGNIATYASGSGHLLELGTGATQTNVIIEHNIT